MPQIQLRLNQEIEAFFKVYQKRYGLTPHDIIEFAIKKSQKIKPNLAKFTPKPCNGVPRRFNVAFVNSNEELRRIITWFARTVVIEPKQVIKIHKVDAQWLDLYPLPVGSVFEYID